jgi:hypothetical protein
MSTKYNINTHLSKKQQVIKDRASFFYNIIQVIARGDILKNTMNMTTEEKLYFLSSEINHYLPFFHTLPEKFKKWVIIHHNISPQIKDTLLPKMKILNKKGGSNSSQQITKFGRATPTPATRPAHTIITQPSAQSHNQAPNIVPMAAALGALHSTQNQLMSNVGSVEVHMQQAQQDVVNINAMVEMQARTAQMVDASLMGNIAIFQERLSKLEADLDKSRIATDTLTKEVTKELDEMWNKAIKEAKKEHTAAGSMLTKGVTEFETKNTKAKICGAVCGGVSGLLFRDLVLSLANAANDLVKLPGELGSGLGALGDTIKGSLGTYNISGVFGEKWAGWQPAALLGSIVEGGGTMLNEGSSTLLAPLTTLVTKCGPQCGSLIGIGCCICTSAICITLLQEHEGTANRLKTKTVDGGWLVLNAARSAAASTQFVLESATVVPLLLKGVEHSKSLAWLEAIKAKQNYDTNKSTYIPHIKRTDMKEEEKGLVSQPEWVQKALKINTGLMILEGETNGLRQQILDITNQIKDTIKRRDGVMDKFMNSVGKHTQADTVNVTAGSGPGSVLRRRRQQQQQSPDPTHRRPTLSTTGLPPVTHVPHGGGLKRRVKSKRLRRNKNRRTKNRSTKKSVKRRNKKRTRRN